MTNLDSVLKIRDITLPTKVYIVKTMAFPVVMCGCESWTIKKGEHGRIEAYYFLGNLQFFALPSLGDVDIKVENLLTNEVFCGEFNSLEDQQYVLYLGEEAGNYEITCTTSSGEVYIGTLCI